MPDNKSKEQTVVNTTPEDQSILSFGQNNEVEVTRGKTTHTGRSPTNKGAAVKDAEKKFK